MPGLPAAIRTIPRRMRTGTALWEQLVHQKSVYNNHCTVQSALMCENNLKPTRLVPIRESHGSNQMKFRRLILKTYCKPATVNIEDWKFNEIAVAECFRNKRSRKDFQRLLCKTGKITKREIAEDQLNKDFKRTLEAESEVAKMLTQRIINRDLQIKPIRQFQRVDGLTHKLRDICQESPEQQVYEYIAVYALKPLFRAKILPIQYGSIPNKGGVAGKRKIERLLRRKLKNKVAAIKGDVTKAYPSVTVPVVMEMLKRDIGKNKVLLWFLGALMSNYPGNHLCIGGYLPAWLDDVLKWKLFGEEKPHYHLFKKGPADK